MGPILVSSRNGTFAGKPWLRFSFRLHHRFSLRTLLLLQHHHLRFPVIALFPVDRKSAKIESQQLCWMSPLCSTRRPVPRVSRCHRSLEAEVFQRIDILSIDFDNIVERQFGTPWSLPQLEATDIEVYKTKKRLEVTISKDDTVILDGAGDKKTSEERCEQAERKYANPLKHRL
ncbi:hypothetical protein MUK42_33568 [Musa troglodytarum]|uniref:Uncharacterized protein n=1 Tax=Musa troglodytarum TaxID=320322 RepID=A0A9E7LB75_9LILI|nr:hypothetical protein MUK42_33568 [Musa troglodytarum]